LSPFFLVWRSARRWRSSIFCFIVIGVRLALLPQLPDCSSRNYGRISICCAPTRWPTGRLANRPIPLWMARIVSLNGFSEIVEGSAGAWGRPGRMRNSWTSMDRARAFGALPRCGAAASWIVAGRLPARWGTSRRSAGCMKFGIASYLINSGTGVELSQHIGGARAGCDVGELRACARTRRCFAARPGDRHLATPGPLRDALLYSDGRRFLWWLAGKTNRTCAARIRLSGFPRRWQWSDADRWLHG